MAAVSRPTLEVADIFRDHGPAWRIANAGHTSLDQLKVMSAIEHCRTAALGGHVECCEDCSYTTIAYNSCRNRHCPKCQAAAARQWLADRQAALLPVPYYHVVFTLPAAVADIAYLNKAVIYDLLFKASAETLIAIAADPKHLGARIGITAVLHTWGSGMTHHIIPPAVPQAAHSRPRRWSPWFYGDLSPLTERNAFAAYLQPLRKAEWVVYAKPPFGGPQAVLTYLSRYTHRVAISNRRLIAADADTVSFRYKDYRCDGPDRYKVMTLATQEFIRRFLIHLLPRGFHRIRHYGLFAQPAAAENIARARQLLAVSQAQDSITTADANNADEPPAKRCPCCGGRMIIIETFARGITPWHRPTGPIIAVRIDTS